LKLDNICDLILSEYVRRKSSGESFSSSSGSTLSTETRGRNSQKVVIKVEADQSLERNQNQNSEMISLVGIVRKGVTLQINIGLQGRTTTTTTRGNMMINQQM